MRALVLLMLLPSAAGFRVAVAAAPRCRSVSMVEGD